MLRNCFNDLIDMIVEKLLHRSKAFLVHENKITIVRIEKMCLNRRAVFLSLMMFLALPASAEQVDIERGRGINVPIDMLSKGFAYPQFGPATKGENPLSERVRSFRLGVLHVDLKTMVARNDYRGISEFQRTFNGAVMGTVLPAQREDVVKAITSLRDMPQDDARELFRSRIEPFFLEGDGRFRQFGESVEGILLALRAGEWPIRRSQRFQDQALQGLNDFYLDVSSGKLSLEGLSPQFRTELKKAVASLSAASTDETDRSRALDALESIKQLF